MPTQNLQIGATVQVAPVQAGMNQMSAVVAAATAQMKKDFESAQETIKSMNVQIADLETSVKKLENALKNGHREHASEAREAQHAVHVLGMLTGVHLPRMVLAWVTSLGGVATAMAAAFSPLMVLGFASIIAKEVPEAIEKASFALQGFGAEAQKRFADAMTATNEFRANMLHVFEFLDKNKGIGLTGTVKTKQELEAIQAENKRLDAEIHDYEELVKKGEAAKENTKVLREFKGAPKGLENFKLPEAHFRLEPQVVPGVMNLGTGLHMEGEMFNSVATEKAIREGEEAGKRLKELNKKREDSNLEATRIRAEEKSDVAKEEYTRHLEILAREKKTGLEQVAIREDVHRRLAELGAFGEAQLTELLLAENEKRRQIELKFARDTNKAKAEEEKRTGTRAPLPISLEEINIEAKKRADLIELNHLKEVKKLEEATRAAKLAGIEEVAMAQAARTEQTAKEWRDQNIISIRTETEFLLDAENIKYDAKKRRLEAEQTDLGNDPTRNAAKIEALNHQLASLEVTHQTALDGIRDSGRQKQLNEDKSILDEKVAAAEQAGLAQLADERENIAMSLKNHDISQKTALDRERVALQQQHSIQATEMQKAIDFAAERYNGDATKYQNLIDKKIEADRKYYLEDKKLQDKTLDDWRKNTDQLANTLTTGLNSWITGQKSLVGALSGMVQNITMQIIQSIEATAARWIAGHLLMTAASKLFHLQENTEEAKRVATKEAADQMMVAAQAINISEMTATQTTANAADLIDEITTNEAKVQSDAGLAGAAGARSAIEALPFPENLIAAPEAGLTAFGIVEAAGSTTTFARGGIVPDTDLALLHKNEMVLPEGISKLVQGAFQSGNTNTGATNAFHYHAAPGESPASIDRNLAALSRAIRDGRLKTRFA